MESACLLPWYAEVTIRILSPPGRDVNLLQVYRTPIALSPRALLPLHPWHFLLWHFLLHVRGVILAKNEKESGLRVSLTGLTAKLIMVC
jgi:hypothetical protein